MNSEITALSKMVILVRREFQEQRIVFLYLPLFIVLLATIAFAVTAIRYYILDFQFIGLVGNSAIVDSPYIDQTLLGFTERTPEEKENFWRIYYVQTLPILYIGFWGAMFYYFQMTLYSQRRDRSVLFWNSLPVNNTETIFSKLIAGFVLCLVIYMICLLAMQLFMLLILMIYGSMFDVSLWENFVAPSGILPRFGRIMGYTFLAVFWCLPFYAWLLLTSAWAKSAPFAWAILPIAFLIVCEVIFFGTGNMGRLFFEHSVPLDNMGLDPNSTHTTSEWLFSGEMLASILLGAVFIYGAIRLNRSEDI
jgi:ABC-2 type transport system permease protein